ncbi:hypothetical protein LVD17_12585 [Fulvivirga ulvae]|uniref:MGH1-like glycoside hydrolase domain-containing protein n=1 Tax=Fulvivirga ulvae TaxID=2904245 RepID=UPI001F16ADAD|nr:trehalase family glycosidase [Fulvivirga ulvae]UII34645.1 hypothetical protein LVD17_12585 [Fulvivirga ulvae]
MKNLSSIPVKLLTLTIAAAFLTLLSCKNDETAKRTKGKPQEHFADILNVKGIPQSGQDNSVSSFSDLGAWHSYAISPEPSGAFAGPYLMTVNNGRWLGPLGEMNIFLDGHSVSFGDASNFASAYYPGHLEQRFTVGQITVEQKLIFISSATALIQTHIINESQTPVKLGISWKGKTWLDNVTLSLQENQGIQYKIDDNQYFVIRPSLKASVTIDSGSYVMSTSEDITLQDEVTLAQVHTLGNEEEIQAEEPLITSALKDPGHYFEANTQRWKQYVDQVTQGLTTEEEKLIAVKTLETLTNNWRRAGGELKHQGFFPSYAYRGFYGFWAWDSWKHAVAAVMFNPDLAKDQIRAMYDYQNEQGMIADCIFRDTLIEKHNWRDTKPPLSGWAIYEIYKATTDTAFVREMYPKLEKYHRWWYQYRDHDQNGLCEYGSTDGTRIAAAWESGMDNAVRFDSANLLKNTREAWSLNQESVDLNAYLYAEKLYMSKLSEIIGLPSETLKKEAKALKAQINNVFYDEASGYYYDVQIGTTQKINVKGPEGWIPVWAGVAEKEQATGVMKQIMDSSAFNTYMPLPTLDASHEKFNPQKGYWRGPVWLDQAYFAIAGLRKYDLNEEADQLTDKILNNAEGLKVRGEPIYENYHPVSGKGLNARHFSWSAAHILLLVKERN